MITLKLSRKKHLEKMMKFDVKYMAPSRWKRSFSRKGTIYMYDTSLLLVGEMPTFRIPFIGWIYFDQVLCTRTTQTIPYSVILTYKSRHFSILYFLHLYHRITYRLPNGKKRTVAFRMLKPKRQNDNSFKTRLEEYMAIAKSLIVE